MHTGAAVTHNPALVYFPYLRPQEQNARLGRVWGCEPSPARSTHSVMFLGFVCVRPQEQNARLGRALVRLSRDLYSKDLHFVLELIQNAGKGSEFRLQSAYAVKT